MKPNSEDMALPGVEAMEVGTMDTIRDVAKALSEGKTWAMDIAHKFTYDPEGKPNLYSRGCLMLPGGIYISEKHKTQHQWFMLRGNCWVYSEGNGWKWFNGPNAGITEPGTQRILYILEPTVWVTAHAVKTDDLQEIYRELIEATEFSGSMQWNELPSVRALLEQSQVGLIQNTP